MVRMELYQQATALQEETVAHRRLLHQTPELGLDLPLSMGYIRARLEAMGCTVSDCAGGLVTLIGREDAPGALLLRADVDALPMVEASGLPFAATGPRAHCCGHDMHAAMLLSAAAILKSAEGSFDGAIKLAFQPGEEVGLGAKAMVEAGLLEGPPVRAAFAMHVDARAPLWSVGYGLGATFASSDSMDITLLGKSGHGARPEEAIDPLAAAARLHAAFADINRLDVPQAEKIILTITRICGGDTQAYNIIPDRAELKASLRCYNEADRSAALLAIRAALETEAARSGIRFTHEFVSPVPFLHCSEPFVKRALEALQSALPQLSIAQTKTVKGGSEDFAYVTCEVPTSGYIFLGAGPGRDEGFPFGQHHPGVIFNEDVLPIGVTALCAVAQAHLSGALYS